MQRVGIIAVLLGSAVVGVLIVSIAIWAWWSRPEPRSDVDSIGRATGCEARDSSDSNGGAEVADVREVYCETDAGLLAPEVASVFVFVHKRELPKSADNVVMRYEVVCESGHCNVTPPSVRWLNSSSLQISVPSFADAYCLERSAIDNVSVTYSKALLRNPPQDAFVSAQPLCL